jgi:beta-xylosidase
MLVKVGPDGIKPAGRPVQLLDRSDRDGPLIEAPNLTKLKDGSYALLYSSNCWNTDKYDVSWARAPTITGPYTRMYTLLTSGAFGLTSPGGASVAKDGTHMVFHANHNGGRAMFSSRIRIV